MSNRVYKKNSIPKPIASALSQIQLTVGKRAVQLSITTRGVGFATAIYYELLCKERNLQEIAEIASIHEVYRVHLMLMHLKVYLSQQRQTECVHSNDTFEHVCLDNEIRNQLAFVTQVPTVISMILDCIGKVIYGDSVWHVGYPRRQNGEPEYRSLVITPDNIRETLDFLANDQSSPAARDDFIAHNSIPGCNFVNGVLANPDDIWPVQYGSQELMADIQKYNNLITKAGKCVQFQSVDWNGGLGAVGVLWSTKRLDLRLISRFSTKTDSGGDSSEQRPRFLECTCTDVRANFWSVIETTPGICLIGTVSLVGEVCCVLTRSESHSGVFVTIDPVAKMLFLSKVCLKQNL